MKVDDTATSPIRMIFNGVQMQAALLVAFGYDWALDIKSYFVGDSLTIGRNPECDLAIKDYGVSSHHARITLENEKFFIEDMNSKNGTFVNGYLLQGKLPLDEASTVIRVNTTIFVFMLDASRMKEDQPAHNHGIVGKYYPGHLLKELQEAASSPRHLLLAGPTGTGKELAAKAFAAIKGKEIRFYNCARYTSSEEAEVALFGVGSKVFSNVSPRTGLIEDSQRGILFLDEAHNLPLRVQRSLLRIVEDGKLERIGESKIREVDVQFVFASNAPPPTYDLAEDLLARLRVIRLPSLKERVADIPSIFDHVFSEALSHGVVKDEKLLSCIDSDHYEALCLDGFESNNIRGIIDLADRLATAIRFSNNHVETINEIFRKRFADGPVSRNRYSIGRRMQANLSAEPSATVTVGDTSALADARRKIGSASSSHYELNKELIIEIYKANQENLSITAELLKERGLSCSRRWLSIFLEAWGVKKK